MARRIITKQQASFGAYLNKVWLRRSLLMTLVKRDLRAKYAQTFLGLFWTLLQPLTGLLIFTLFFTYFLPMETHGVPYPLFAFAGLMLWFHFTTIVSGGGVSLMNNADLIQKISFPRLLLPLSKVLVALLELLMTMTVLIILMLVFEQPISWKVGLAPLFILLAAATGLAVAIWLAALTIRYRDFHHLIPYVVNYGIWLTPVLYPITIIPEAYHWIVYSVNPMALAVEGFRWSVFDTPAPPDYAYWSVLLTLVLLISGIFYFRKIEGDITDHL